MPVRFTIDHDKRYVTVRATGVVLLDEVLDYFDALVTQNAMPYRKLFDAREAQPQLSDDDVMVLGARVSAYAEMEQFLVPDGTPRRFLEDGDRVTFTAWCQGDGYRVGFGELTGRVLAAVED